MEQNYAKVWDWDSSKLHTLSFVKDVLGPESIGQLNNKLDRKLPHIKPIQFQLYNTECR